MTRAQLALARAALGLPNPRNHSYRNHYPAARGAVREEWDDMAEAGFAIRRTGEAETGPATFALTRAGADRAVKPGETLDATDFPPIGAH